MPARPQTRRSVVEAVDLLGVKYAILQPAEMDPPARVAEIEDDEPGGAGLRTMEPSPFAARSLAQVPAAQ